MKCILCYVVYLTLPTYIIFNIHKIKKCIRALKFLYTLSWGNKTEFGRKCIVAEPLRDIELKYFLRKCIVEKGEKNIFFGISYFFIQRKEMVDVALLYCGECIGVFE